MCHPAALWQHAVKYGGHFHRRTQGRRSDYAHVAVTVRARESRMPAQTRPPRRAGKLPFALAFEQPQRSKAPPAVRFFLPKHSGGRDDRVA